VQPGTGAAAADHGQAPRRVAPGAGADLQAHADGRAAAAARPGDRGGAGRSNSGAPRGAQEASHAADGARGASWRDRERGAQPPAAEEIEQPAGHESSAPTDHATGWRATYTNGYRNGVMTAWAWVICANVSS
jgi:hypothetical protein